LLHEGLEVREAAGRLKTTLETARFHLKRVLAQTGTATLLFSFQQRKENGVDGRGPSHGREETSSLHFQKWYPEALEIADELRLNSREIKWHIGRLRGASKTGHLYEQFPIYAQRAVATYYLMTRSLLVLYEGISRYRSFSFIVRTQPLT
jgi:hypothetical protein